MCVCVCACVRPHARVCVLAASYCLISLVKDHGSFVFMFSCISWQVFFVSRSCAFCHIY